MKVKISWYFYYDEILTSKREVWNWISVRKYVGNTFKSPSRTRVEVDFWPKLELNSLSFYRWFSRSLLFMRPSSKSEPSHGYHHTDRSLPQKVPSKILYLQWSNIVLWIWSQKLNIISCSHATCLIPEICLPTIVTLLTTNIPDNLGESKCCFSPSKPKGSLWSFVSLHTLSCWEICFPTDVTILTRSLTSEILYLQRPDISLWLKGAEIESEIIY